MLVLPTFHMEEIKMKTYTIKEVNEYWNNVLDQDFKAEFARANGGEPSYEAKKRLLFYHNKMDQDSVYFKDWVALITNDLIEFIETNLASSLPRKHLISIIDDLRLIDKDEIVEVLLIALKKNDWYTIVRIIKDLLIDKSVLQNLLKWLASHRLTQT